MTESGGPTTQAGIDYQNKIAALYLGALLGLDGETSARVVAVRVEAAAIHGKSFGSHFTRSDMLRSFGRQTGSASRLERTTRWPGTFADAPPEQPLRTMSSGAHV